ncbi:MAG: PAS domain-containing protein, partial [Elusimicrobia bacterium]|nr:PAS domain-containing protein [Elusimicrobiota bacterium]
MGRPSPDSPLVYLSTQVLQAKEYLEAIVASTTDAICTTDLKGRLIYFSPGAERMLGRKAERVIGTFAHSLYEGGRGEAWGLMRRLLRSGKLRNHETVLRGDGCRVHVSMSMALLRDRHGRRIGTLAISKDITERV